MTDGYHPRVEADCIPLMKQLAAMAGMSDAPIKRMTLVLDVDHLPILYVESFLDKNKMAGVELEKTNLTVVPQVVEVKDTTSIQNEMFRTYSPANEEPKQYA